MPVGSVGKKDILSNLFLDTGMVQRSLTLRQEWVKQRDLKKVHVAKASNMANENFMKRKQSAAGGFIQSPNFA